MLSANQRVGWWGRGRGVMSSETQYVCAGWNGFAQTHLLPLMFITVMVLPVLMSALIKCFLKKRIFFICQFSSLLFTCTAPV